MAARIRMRPPQRSQRSASRSKTRRKSSAQGSLLSRSGAGLGGRRSSRDAAPGSARFSEVGGVALCAARTAPPSWVAAGFAGTPSRVEPALQGQGAGGLPAVGASSRSCTTRSRHPAQGARMPW
jgi:hypothetical protein